MKKKTQTITIVFKTVSINGKDSHIIWTHVGCILGQVHMVLACIIPDLCPLSYFVSATNWHLPLKLQHLKFFSGCIKDKYQTAYITAS